MLSHGNEPATPLFVATQRFDPSDGQKWSSYVESARIPGLIEVVSLDSVLCPLLIQEVERTTDDWEHIVCEDGMLDFFYHLDYLMGRIAGVSRRNVLGLYRNPGTHIDVAPGAGKFIFMGYDVIEEAGQISALTNCGGFPETLSNEELNQYGLISRFARACEVRRLLAEHNPEEPHAQCKMYAIWRLAEI